MSTTHIPIDKGIEDLEIIEVKINLEDVSQSEGIGYETVMGVVRRHIQTKVDWKSIERLEQIR